MFDSNKAIRKILGDKVSRNKTSCPECDANMILEDKKTGVYRCSKCGFGITKEGIKYHEVM